MPGGEMVEPAKGAKTTAKSEMPGADMNVPVAEEVAAVAAGPRRVTSARKPAAKKPAAKKPAARKPSAARRRAK